MTAGTWKPLEDNGGIMMWEPTAAVKSEHVAQLSTDIYSPLHDSYDPDFGTLVLPSIEQARQVYVYRGSSEEYGRSRFPTMSRTLSASPTRTVLSDAAGTVTPPSSPPLLEEGSWEEQLRVFAQLARERYTSTVAGAPTSSESHSGRRLFDEDASSLMDIDVEHASNQIRVNYMEHSPYSGRPSVVPHKFVPSQDTPLSVTSIDIGYSSDQTSTDFTKHSPCPRRPSSNSHKAVLSKFFEDKPRRKKSTPIAARSVARRIDFKEQVSRGRRAKPKAIEYSKPQKWTSTQRIFLCVMWRWYERDIEAFTQIYNAVHSPTRPQRIVRDQFENHVRLHGGEAFSEYRQVFETAFDDLEGHFLSVRIKIETTAKSLGINIQRRQRDSNSPSGMAAHAKSKLTQKAHKSLVRRAREAAQVSVPARPEIAHPPQHDNIPTVPIGGVTRVQGGGFTLATQDQGIEGTYTDVEVPPTSPVIDLTADPQVQRPCLLFRVWDASSRTRFGPEGFRSIAFDEWTDIPAPIPRDDPHQVFKLLAHLHLSKRGDTPCFISAAESLLQVLTIASSLNHPQIALIDLNAPCMQQEHKTHLASEVMIWLKNHGVKLRYRYKGHGDWFAFGTIPKEAILKHFKLEELVYLCDCDNAAAKLLNLDAFQPGRKTVQVASAMRDLGTVLNNSVARAMGRLAKLFLANTAASLAHISAFVTRLMDGWYIEKNEATDMHSMSTMAHAFATNLGPHQGLAHQQIMGAFIDGVDEGTRCVARWSQSNPGQRRMRR